MQKLLRLLRLTPYGQDEIVLVTLALLGAAYGLAALTPWAALAALPPWLFFLNFFRDPPRVVPSEPYLLVAPADGTVQDISELGAAPFLNSPAVRIGIFLSPLNVHLNRAPCAGRVEYLKFTPGLFLPAFRPEAVAQNEAQELGLATPEGLRVLVKQISGVAARRIVCAAEQGQILTRGEQYGMIKFGSRTELYFELRAGFELTTQLGARVRAGETILARRRPALAE